MKLTVDEIVSAANGFIRIEQNELGVEFHRFSRGQEGFFYKVHPLYCRESFFNGYFGRNCRTASGITLDFISDAKEISIEFGKVEYSIDSLEANFDMYVDGEFAKSYLAGEEIRYVTNGKQQRYTLYFPCFAFPIVSSVDLQGATTFIPQRKPIEMLFVGDSITHGAHAKHPSNTYVMKVARNLDIGILNQGSSGFVYDEGSIEKVCDPKIIVTAYGINDYGRKNLELLETQTTAFLKKMRNTYPNAKILSILPIWTAWDGENENFRKTERACLRMVYEAYSDYVVDGHELMPHDKKYLQDGLVHPNDDGFIFYGDRLTEILRKITRQ